MSMSACVNSRYRPSCGLSPRHAFWIWYRRNGNDSRPAFSTTTAEALVDSLHHDMVCGETYDDFTCDLLPSGHQLVDVRTAITRSLERPRAGTRPGDRDPMGALPGDPDFAGGGVYLFDGAVRRRPGLRRALQLGPVRPRWLRSSQR